MANEPFIDFQRKKVVVTGASCGIGCAVAEELSRYGASVVLVGRDAERLSRCSALLKPGKHYKLIIDLKDRANIVPAIRSFAKEQGKIYGLCHAARVDDFRPLSYSTPETLDSLLELNVTAGIELAGGVCRHDVIEEDGGSVLFLSSIAGRVGIPGRIGYSASHGGISAAARSMAIELARRKIRVNTISPGMVEGGISRKVLSRLSAAQLRDIEKAHPLGVGQIRDVARAAVFLLAPQTSWITGTDLVVDGGYSAQ
jgi:NAD(P)-dependent dehydrogenase (short-subunit alcohol dehydrogenase family)